MKQRTGKILRSTDNPNGYGVEEALVILMKEMETKKEQVRITCPDLLKRVTDCNNRLIEVLGTARDIQSNKLHKIRKHNESKLSANS